LNKTTGQAPVSRNLILSRGKVEVSGFSKSAGTSANCFDNEFVDLETVAKLPVRAVSFFHSVLASCPVLSDRKRWQRAHRRRTVVTQFPHFEVDDGFDGIMFRSVQDESGCNYVLFEEKNIQSVAFPVKLVGRPTFYTVAKVAYYGDWMLVGERREQGACNSWQTGKQRTMNQMRTCTPHPIAIALAIAGPVVGLIAAWCWLRSASVPLALPVGESYDPNSIEPVELELKALAWHVEQIQASQATWEAQVRASREIGRLNAIAAVLTAVALMLSTVSAVIAAL
jgi:hypothetical protein